MLKKMNWKKNNSGDSSGKRSQLFVARLKYYYQSVLCRTHQGSVRYSASSLVPFSKREGTVQHYKSKIYIWQVYFLSLLNIFGEHHFYELFRKVRAVLRWPSLLEKVGMMPCHINFISLLTTFGESLPNQPLRKARAVLRGLPLPGKVGWGLLIFILSSCRLGKEYQRPPLQLPKQFNTVSFSDTSSIADIEWRKFFTNPELQSLIQKGITYNNDMLVAIKRLDIAQRRVNQSKALQLPKVDLLLAGQISRPSNNSLSGIGLKNFIGQSYVEYYSAGVNLSWEADIWGKIRGQKEIALTEYLLTTEAAKAVQTQLVADIAQGFFNLLMLDKQLNIARKNLLLSDSFVVATRLLKDAGLGNALGVQQAESQKLSTALLIPQLEQSIALQENALQLLTGQLPASITVTTSLNEVVVTENFSAGLPVAMVSRRPDVRATELALMRANSLIGIAQANMYPALNITVGGGLESFKRSNWFNIPNALFGLAGASIAQPIFRRRELKTNFEIAKLQREEAVIQFRQSVLQATIEVANVVVQMDKLKQQQQIAAMRVDTLRHAVFNAQLLFKSDMANYLEVITAQSNALEAELNLASIQRQQLNAMVELYRSLGGGWK